jgi:hypothetical protein
LLTILVGIAGLLAFLLQSKLLGLMPPCLFHRLTTLYCPGCGGRRCVMMLAEGRWLDALRMNAFVIAVGLGFGSLLLRETWREWSQRGKPFALTPRMGWGIAIGVVAFWVLRNIRCWPFEWLAPFSL